MLDPALLTEAQKALHTKPLHELSRAEIDEATAVADMLGDRDRSFALKGLKLQDLVARTDGTTGAILPPGESAAVELSHAIGSEETR